MYVLLQLRTHLLENKSILGPPFRWIFCGGEKID